MSVEVFVEKMGVFKWLVVLIGCMAAAITSLYLVGYQQKQAAIAFWGGWRARANQQRGRRSVREIDERVSQKLQGSLGRNSHGPARDIH